MTGTTLAILENLEGQLGKAFLVQGEPPFIRYAVAKNLSELVRDASMSDMEIQHKVIVFERTEECLPVGNFLAVVYRQVTVDGKADG